MTNLRRILSVGLAAASLALVLPFFAGGIPEVQVGLLKAGLGPAVQAGLLPQVLQESFVPVVPISAIALAVAAFAVSWKQRSFLVSGLLAASGVVFMVPALIATGYLSFIVFPGPVIGVILGVVMFGLGVAKGVGTAKAETVIAR